jgi:hypothetical protein
MTTRFAAPGVLLLTALVSACSTRTVSRPPQTTAELRAVSRDSLCVTEGDVQKVGDRQMQVTSAAMRAVVSDATTPIATVHFVYQGPSADTAPLADGEIRRQIGLKLDAADTCNVLYVMWRIEPPTGIVVSVKSNPGKHTHAECGAQGYRTVMPRMNRTVAPVAPGEEHTLEAAVHGGEVKVYADHQLAWEGDLGEDASLPSGPVGIRTDNGRFAFELAAIGAGGGALAGHCREYAAAGD